MAFITGFLLHVSQHRRPAPEKLRDVPKSVLVVLKRDIGDRSIRSNHIPDSRRGSLPPLSGRIQRVLIRERAKTGERVVASDAGRRYPEELFKRFGEVLSA